MKKIILPITVTALLMGCTQLNTPRNSDNVPYCIPVEDTQVSNVVTPSTYTENAYSVPEYDPILEQPAEDLSFGATAFESPYSDSLDIEETPTSSTGAESAYFEYPLELETTATDFEAASPFSDSELYEMPDPNNTGVAVREIRFGQRSPTAYSPDSTAPTAYSSSVGSISTEPRQLGGEKRLYIQVFATISEDTAHDVVEDVRRFFPDQTSVIRSAGIYRVPIGPLEENETKAVMDEINQQKDYKTAFVLTHYSEQNEGS
ncbi:hypothetical protein [Vibrio sp. HI00D65]|uniref:hypothetical protein n=1 Tax=Vibrio sp. HI00D65 TaxID=1822216 RepID=UPI0012F734F4|nr:hypothetical protein [Vibrio sp. HI00D65]